ncbi:MAG: gliding motility lipoprotein GldH [Bacteroidales bacterium]|nr:gliding motility lipoprotein GldH [Bacteroidales bacterium]
MRSFVLKIPALVLLLLVIVACDDKVILDKSQSIENSQWNMLDKKSFSVDISDKDKVYQYRFALNIRNTADYKYNNVYFFISTVYPDGSVTRRDTVECILANDDGTWKGKGNSGVKDNRFWFASNVKFPQKGRYVFNIEQATKDTVLYGIKDIGLHIEKQPL